MTGISSGGGGGYDYVEASYPSDAKEGESLYHLTENAAYVYTGTEWVEQTVTDHSQLSGVSAGDHRTDSNVRATVDGANITVDNADNLGGQPPSNYVPPDSTGSSSGTARWENLRNPDGDNIPTSGYLTYSLSDEIACGVEIQFGNYDGTPVITFVINGEVTKTVEAGSGGVQRRSVTFGTRPVHTVEIQSSADTGGVVELNVKRLGFEQHNHPVPN